jgi:hypothetical protein
MSLYRIVLQLVIFILLTFSSLASKAAEVSALPVLITTSKPDIISFEGRGIVILNITAVKNQLCSVKITNNTKAIAVLTVNSKIVAEVNAMSEIVVTTGCIIIDENNQIVAGMLELT